ncbi:MAG: ABC transporter ATP-binding protein [Thermoleophilia bacterium]|nr:ABC transporter ATP-binding protein [Thermoleophilia bacterium]
MNGTSDGDAIANLSHVTKEYGSGDTLVRALRGIDLEIRAGEFVVLLGPSGSGKTTLLNLVGGIEASSGGEIVVDGQTVSELGEAGRTRFRRETVGFVYQFFNLVPTLTALENVELIADLVGHDGIARAREMLGRVGLAERVDHFPAELSGGEQQRVAVARALAASPRMLLCDEPTGALDLETGRVVLALLREVNRESRRTILVVTHNASVARMADRVLRLRSGRIVEDEHNEHPVEAGELVW